MLRSINLVRSLDWTSIMLYLIMVVCGWFCIYSVGYGINEKELLFDISTRASKQLIWILISCSVAFMLLLIDFRFYNSFMAHVIYILVILLLILTIFIAPDVKGSRSWIVLGPISIQPAEFAKFATALAFARTMELVRKQYSLRNILLLGLIVFLPASLIFLQKEMGTAIIFSVFFLVFYREGMSGFFLLSGMFAISIFIVVVRFGQQSVFGLNGDLGLVFAFAMTQLVVLFFLLLLKDRKKDFLTLLGALLSIFFSVLVFNYFIPLNFNYVFLLLISATVFFLIVKAIKYREKIYTYLLLFVFVAILFSFASNSIFYSVLKPHQQTRIKIVLNMESDLSGAGYNVNQSKIAIGSGGFLGKGFLEGTQTKLKFVPEQDTDFIFCTIGEEFGFLGAGLLLLLYLFFLLRLLFIAERQRSVFSRVYGYCVASIFFFHILVNVGMVLGLMPVIGIPLPFFSYGGSSILGFTILLFILLRLDATRSERLL